MIELVDVGFRYRGGADPVVTGISHVFRPGVVTGVAGPSGCGKSTLLYLLGLMLTPTAGDVLVRGRRTSGMADGQRAALRASLVGFVFQDALLDPSRTVLDNVLEGALFAGVDRRKAARRALALLDALDVRARLDHRPGEISGGQAQRVALCRALVTEPGVILADEPTGNLDPDSAAVVWDVLRDRARSGAAVVVATHDPLRLAETDERLQVWSR